MSETRDTATLADEYVLGLLDPADEARVDTLIESDPLLRAAVGASRDRFVELDLVAESTIPSPGLWDRIAATIDSAPPAVPSRPDPRGRSADSGTGPVPGASNDNLADRWRRLALAATAASLLLAAGLGWNLLFAPAPVVVAVLLDTAGEPLALVEDFGNASARVTPLADFAIPAGRALELWTLPSAERGPVSLGTLDRSRTKVLEGPALPAPLPDQLYEITLEQAGGSPTGRPTGPLLVKGFGKVPR